MCVEDVSVSDTDRGLNVIFTSVGSDTQAVHTMYLHISFMLCVFTSVMRYIIF